MKRLKGILILIIILGIIPFVSATSCLDTIYTDTILTENLTDCSGGSGLTIGASDVTLDCDGYSIIMADPSTGIYISSLNNVTVKNCNVVGVDNAGVYMEYSTNSSIINSNFNGAVWGMYLVGISDTQIIDSSGSGEQGIDLEGSWNNTITNSVGTGGYNGFQILGSSENDIINSVGISGGNGFYLQSSPSNYFFNNTANSNGNFGFYLWLSDNNIIDSNTANSNIYHGIYVWQSSGESIENNIANLNGYFGIILSETGNSLIHHNTANSNTESGILVSTVSNNNIISSNTANYNTNSGLYFTVSSSDNTITDNTFISNSVYGIALTDTSINETIKGNIISLNGLNGIAISDSSLDSIYNNFFNNTNNVDLGLSSPNDWNRTKLAGLNIINGGFLAGNYWATPTGSGFSETCTNVNGICSENYTIGVDNIDYIPLASSTNYFPINISRLIQLTSIYKQNTATDIKIACFDDNNNYCTIASICKLTLISPNSSIIVNDQQMTYSGPYFNYSLTPNQVPLSGPYSVTVVCSSTNSANINWVDTVTPMGKQFALSDVLVYIFFLIICLTITIFSVRLTNSNSMQKDEMTGSKLYQVKKRSEVKFYLNLLKKKMWIIGVFGIYLSTLLFLSLLAQLTFSLGLSELTDILGIIVQILGWGLIPFIIFWVVYVIIFLWKSTEDILKYQLGGFRGDGL